ncbi:MAG: hypothetical protein JXR76_05290 [Deltaproteobacteria bacterium]|nr:hypothetical protein [Deltaproteobacteria bacterium]
MKQTSFLSIAFCIAAAISCSDDSKFDNDHECTEENVGQNGCDCNSDGTCNDGLICETWKVTSDTENIVWQEFEGTCVEDNSTDV